MAILRKGKCFVLYLLFLFSLLRTSRVLANSDLVAIQDANERFDKLDTDYEIDELVDRHQMQIGEKLGTDCETEVVDRHQRQVEKLEDLLRNLTELVSRLESRFSDERLDEEVKSIVAREVEDGDVPVKIFEEKSGLDKRVHRGERDRMGGKGASVTMYDPFWSERFQSVSAVELKASRASCINVLPFRDHEGLSKYFAVGDDRGRVFVFPRNGDVLVEFDTLADSPVTAMLSYLSVYKNESVVVTGHGNGLILVHRVWEESNGEDWTAIALENRGRLDLDEIGENGSPVSLLEVHHVGRTRYILSADGSGKIRVLRENGTVYGLAVPASRPLVFLKQRLLFLTETGAGSLDLRTMKVRESECEGLNRSSVEIYVFDATERSKAYGFTSEGDMIHVLLLGDIMNFKCRVRSKRKFGMDKPLAMEAIKGYLLVVNQEKVFVYNVSSQHYTRAGGPRLLFSADLDEIRSSFPNYRLTDLDAQKGMVMPLLASDTEKLLVLGLGDGHVRMYRSNLPIFKGESNTILWTSPVFFFILFLFGAWQFFAKKKESLISWGPDDPFNSMSISNGGAPLGSGSGDRSFTESSSRGGDAGDLRGGGAGGLRGPTRRYVSPSRYPGGSTTSFRNGSADTNSSRPSVDPNLRTTSEQLKFRGSNLDSTGFQKRRESLFVTSQVVDDSS
ncbi:uncharacterized membrane protein At1g75140 [Rhododendron vialii]|uniref:uncharacterized membrane protein At1g75140 n=1 Tax=Rhododendron vialii TaxID=182163 RepID=UPI00265E48EC|nr:uncharacterized membrane protein At1g75140 [Rhododendron vialii]